VTPALPATTPVLPATPERPVTPVPAAGPVLPATPERPVTPVPAAGPALPSVPALLPGPAVPVVCAMSWGVNVVSALIVPTAAGNANRCGAGAVRPAAAGVACTSRVGAGGLQAAVNAARPGDRVCVHGGSSPTRLTITRSGGPGRPVVVLGDGSASVKGLTVTANNVVVSGLNVARPAAPGVELTGTGITLVNSVIASPRGGDGDGIRFFGSNLRILHNTVTDVRNLGGAHADCMQTFATDADSPASRNVLIDSNRCERIDNQCLIAEGPHSSAGDGSGKGRSSDIVFTHNVCDSHASQAVWIDDVQNVSVTYNNINGGNQKAFAFDNKSTGAKVVGNVIGAHIGFEVGMDPTSKIGYAGPRIGGEP
jgi:hypothetical protein